MQDDPTAAGSRLFSQPLTAPGSAASFSPLPPSALAQASGPVQTHFIGLAFDAHASDDSAKKGTTGTTRLEFKSASGAAVPVSGLSTPITFTLPASPTLGVGKTAGCVFYDTAAGNYSSAGCAALPNPLPSGIAAGWVPNATVSSAAQLPLTWSLSAASASGAALIAGCGQVLLDCSDPAQRNRTVYPDPTRPFAVAPVSCGASTSVLRVFNGSGCGLIANAGCYWNQSAQAFSGPACVPAAQTNCAPPTHLGLGFWRSRPARSLASSRHPRLRAAGACLHLTDFAAQARATLPLASALPNPPRHAAEAAGNPPFPARCATPAGRAHHQRLLRERPQRAQPARHHHQVRNPPAAPLSAPRRARA